MKTLLSALAMVALSTAPAAGAIGFQRVAVPDSDDRPREVGIWYPSDAPASPQPLGPHRQTVAIDGAVAGHRLPLVVILHGVQGSFDNHHLTALALARAGVVVAAVNQSQDMRLVERPRHVRRLLDYLLADWPSHDRLDPARIGIFGFSLGGFTALVAIGGVPDLGRIPAYCAEYADRVCGMLRGVDTSTPAFTFGPDALAAVKVPIQLWRAANDAINPHPRAAEAIYHALPAKPDYVVVPNAGHFVFIACGADMAKGAPAICRDAADFDRPAFHQRLDAAVVAFFTAHLPTTR